MHPHEHKKESMIQWLRSCILSMDSRRIAFTREGFSDFLQEPTHFKEKVICLLSVIYWHCCFWIPWRTIWHLDFVEFVIFVGGTLSLFSIKHLWYYCWKSWQIGCKYITDTRTSSLVSFFVILTLLQGWLACWFWYWLL